MIKSQLSRIKQLSSEWLWATAIAHKLFNDKGKKQAVSYHLKNDTKVSSNERILVISDMHAPYTKEWVLEFLQELKDKYNPDRVICIWDELDYHALSYHEVDPDLDSAAVELQKGREFLWKVEEIFPVMDLVHSNHGSMHKRKSKTAWMPRHLIKDYRDVIFWNGKWEGWTWSDSVTLTMSNWEDCHFVHYADANIVNHAARYWMSLVAGHRHTKFELWYSSSPFKLVFGMCIWCLIDDNSYAYAYNKLQSRRPILWVWLILDWIPQLIPMPLTK